MARRMTEDSADTLMSFRISQKMKVIVDKYADLESVSSAEWIREAIQMRIERESHPEKQTFRDMAELEEYIKAAIKKELQHIESDEKQG